MELNAYGRQWVDGKLDEINEDAVYASIGAYDPEAFKDYCRNEKDRLTEIALQHQDDPEFQLRNTPPA